MLVAIAQGATTLLIVDAWFDLTTARRGGFTQRLAVTLLIEIPAALEMLGIAQRAARRVVHDVTTLDSASLLKMPLHSPKR